MPLACLVILWYVRVRAGNTGFGGQFSVFSENNKNIAMLGFFGLQCRAGALACSFQEQPGAAVLRFSFQPFGDVHDE
jgi:hypothetical protein